MTWASPRVGRRLCVVRWAMTCAGSLFLLGSGVARAEAALVDEVVAVVALDRIRESGASREPVVTLGEAEAEARILRSTELGPATLLDPLPPALLSRALEVLVAELVLENEAERLQVYRVTDLEASTAAEAFARRHPKVAFDQFRKQHALDTAALNRVFLRKVRVLKYLDGRFRLQAKPSEAEVREEFVRRAGEFTNLAPEVAVAQVREELQRRRFTALADAYVADVRRRAAVRILRDPSTLRIETPTQGTVKAADFGRAAGTR